MKLMDKVLASFKQFGDGVDTLENEVKAGKFVTIEGRPVFIGGPGGGGGSASSGGYPQETIDGALKWVQQLTLSSRPGDLPELTQDQRDFLAQTVDKKNYTAYHGLGLIKDRVAPEHGEVLNSLSPGDSIPDFLRKQGNPYESWTAKRGVARAYSEGRMSIVLKTRVPGSAVVVNTAKLPQLLKGITQSVFDDYDMDYFKDEAELLIEGLPSGVIYSISGQLSKQLDESTKQAIQPKGQPLSPWTDEEVPISDEEIDLAIAQWNTNPELKKAKGILDAKLASIEEIASAMSEGVKAGKFVTIEGRPVFIGGPGGGGGGALDEETLDAMGFYFGDGYEHVNAHLRGTLRDEDITDYDLSMLEVDDRVEYRDMLDSIVADIDGAALPVGREMTVFRGLDATHLNQLGPGDTFTEAGFTSTTSDVRVAEANAVGGFRLIMSVRLNPNDRVIDGSRHGVVPEEVEWLLPSGTAFRILRESHYPILGGASIIEWEVDLVKDK